MSEPTKEEALAAVGRAQAKFKRTQRQLGQDSEARRESFEQAQQAGASLREIGEAAGLHWSTVEVALRKQ